MLIAKCVSLDNGYLSDVEVLKELRIKIGDELVVENISMGQCVTYFKARELPRVLNSVNFDFYEDEEIINIYRDMRFNPYMRK